MRCKRTLITTYSMDLPYHHGKYQRSIFRNARDHVNGVIKEIDEDFLVLEKWKWA